MEYAEYLSTHGISKEYVEKNWAWSFDNDRITIPAYDKDGKLHHNNYRQLNSDNKFTGDPGSHPSLYGIHKASKKKVVVYCEGQADCVKLWQENIPAVTATGGVKKFDEDMAIQLKDKRVFICLDSDEAGKKEVPRYYDLLTKYAEQVRIVDLPVGYKDVCEAFVAGCDREYFLALMKDSPRTLSEWRVKNMPVQHRIETLGELFEADIPDEEWILDKVIPRVGFSMIAGASAVGKSFLSLDMARAIVTGERWLDRYEVIDKVKVLFVDKENERASFRKRCRGLNMQGVGDKIFRIVFPEVFQLEGRETFSDFAKDVAAFVEHHDIQLIIFDSLVDFISGDENSGGDTSIFFNNIKELLPGRSIMFPAHYGKSVKGDSRSPLERIAGSRNLGAQITSGLAVERSTEADNEILIQSLKARNEINDTTQFKVLIHSKIDPEDPMGTIVTGFEYTGEVEEKVEKVTGAIDLITKKVDEMGDMGVKIRDAIDACMEAGIAKRTAEMAKGQMVKSGMFETRSIEGSREKTINRVLKTAKTGIYD